MQEIDKFPCETVEKLKRSKFCAEAESMIKTEKKKQSRKMLEKSNERKETEKKRLVFSDLQLLNFEEKIDGPEAV